jgi:hypothetical protein
LLKATFGLIAPLVSCSKTSLMESTTTFWLSSKSNDPLEIRLREQVYNSAALQLPARTVQLRRTL